MEDLNHNSSGKTAESVSQKMSKQEKELQKLKLAKAKRRQKVSQYIINSPFRFIVEQRTKEKEQIRAALERG